MICVGCVTPELLKKIVSAEDTKGICRYCGSDNLAFDANPL